jgi:archaeal cell division control protein 6
MKQKGLGGFFEKYLEKDSLFKEKKVLQGSYTPDELLHRDEEIKKLAEILAPCLKEEKPSNLFIYGNTGTGKTASIKYTASQLLNISTQRDVPLKILYLNCKLKRVADTEYRLVAQLAREFGKIIPPTGLPTDEVYNIFFNVMDEKKQNIILVLDEIDFLVKKAGDEILYNLTRIDNELKNSQISVVGISNNTVFIETLDPRVKSSLSEEEVIFPPYNAIQLQNILRERAKTAFKPGVLSEGVIEKCAAYAAHEHGDARRALELLRVAGEIAERNNYKKIYIKHIDEAEDKIERDRIIEVVKTQPKQFQAILYSILTIYIKRRDVLFTGEIYELYKKICSRTNLRPLTQRRVSDILGEFDMLGIINAKLISKGRYGRTREITLAVPEHLEPRLKEIIEKDLNLS